MQFLKQCVVLFSVFMSFVFLNCKEYSATEPNIYENYNLVYNISGGFGGMNKTLWIFEDKEVKYTGRSYNIKSEMDDQSLLGIYELFVENDFFELDSLYMPDQQIMDGINVRLEFESATRSNSIYLSTHYINYVMSDTTVKVKLRNIFGYLDEYINTLTNSVDMGNVTIRSKAILEEWPFGDKISLSDYLNKSVGVDEEVFNFLKEKHQLDDNVKYFQDGLIYQLVGSGGYAFSYSDLDTFYINIYNPKEGMLWPLELKLSDITDDGIVVEGDAYIMIKDTLNTSYYPRYFYDTAMETGEYVYEIDLVTGNDF